MCLRRAKFHLNPTTLSIGSPGPITSLPAFPLGRPRSPSISPLGLGDFPAVFFSWSARANGERETAAIQYPDLSGHKLALHQVSSRSVHAFYRLPPSLSIFPGPFRSFSSSTAGLNGLSRLGLFPGLFLVDGTGKRRRGESGNLTSRPLGATTSSPPSFITIRACLL